MNSSNGYSKPSQPSNDGSTGPTKGNGGNGGNGGIVNVDPSPGKPAIAPGKAVIEPEEKKKKKPKQQGNKSKNNTDNTVTKEEDRIAMPDIALWREPKGELLFFLKPSETLQVEISTDKSVYAPGNKVKFSVKILNKDNKKLSLKKTFVSIVVTDDSVFNRVEDKL
jgi:hypothetical protein